MTFDFPTDSVVPELLAGVFWFFLVMLFQIAALWRLNPQTAVGDEAEYLQATTKSKASQLWVRVPLFYLFGFVADQIHKPRKVLIVRIFVSLISATIVGLAVAYTQSQAGFAAGLTVGLVMLASVERMVLAIHVWPDTLLGLWSLLFLIGVLHVEGPVGWALLGGVAALGFLTRLDFVLLSGFGMVTAVLWANAPMLFGVLVVGPTLLAALILTVHNGVAHGIWRVDTTASFNLRVSTLSMENPQLTTQELMCGAIEQTHAQPRATPVLGNFVFTVLRSPARFMQSFVERVLIFLGQETFVVQNLDQTNGARYRQSGRPFFTSLSRLNLVHGFAIVLVIFVLLSPVTNPIAMALVGTLVFGQTAFQTRSRYRMSVFPILCTTSVISVWQIDVGGVSFLHFALSGLCAFGLLMLLVCVPPRPEKA